MGSLPQIVVNGLVIGGVYALVAIGYAMVYGVLRLINFAHGGVFTAGAFLGLVLVGWLHIPLVLAMPGVALAGAILGIAIERVAYRPVRGSPILVQLITAIGVAMIIENGVAAVFGSDARSLPPDLTSSGVFGGVLGIRVTGVQLLIIALSVALLLFVWWLVMRTAVGRAMRAVADDPEGAVTSGINADRVITMAFGLGSAMGAIAGMVVSMDVGCDPYMGTVVGFKAFTACVLGGIGRLSGAVIGGIAIGVFENLVAGFVSTEYKTAVVMGVLVTLLLFRPGGLLSTFKERTV